MSIEFSIEDLWDLSSFTPNDEQKKAIKHTEGPLFITAGPGSGKTRVLLWRTLNLIVFHKVDPSEIYLSTFTEKAARQLIDGLRSLLGMVTNLNDHPYDISRMSVGTIHSICRKLIIDRRFTQQGERRKQPKLLDELAQYFKVYNRRYWIDLINEGGYVDEETAQRSINELISKRGFYSRHLAVENTLKLFNRFSEESYKPNGDTTNDQDLNNLLRMYLNYLKKMKTDSSIEQVDFSLLQQSTYEIIEQSMTSENVFKHVIIDEYQDTNAIQERIFFKLARGHKNICVVGDDDQSLYRFRGATVENLVEFEKRCEKHIGTLPTRVDLNINYRSRQNIVETYKDFIKRADWKKQNSEKGHYRVHDKIIKAHRQDEDVSVITTEKAKADDVYDEIAKFVKKLKDEEKIEDYNQIAFLFPAMKNNSRVNGFRQAFRNLDIPIYAPRAGRFLEVPEAQTMFGLFLMIFTRPKWDFSASRGLKEFQNWMLFCERIAGELCADDDILYKYVADKKEEIKIVLNDYQMMMKLVNKKKWNIHSNCTVEMIRPLSSISGLSGNAVKNLTNKGFISSLKWKAKNGEFYSIRYIINRATSFDWSLLDLFYQLCGFKHFRKMFDLAEEGIDEGPICNLGLISQYITRFMDDNSTVLTAGWLSDDKFINMFAGSFLYALYRLGESEYENAEDPFPIGRVPFLTIHQAKGLEFPVVVLGSVFKRDYGPPVIEEIIRSLMEKEGEPLDKISEFDRMRLFYVALSRAKNLVVLPRYTHANAASEPFKTIFTEEKLTKIVDFDLNSIPKVEEEKDELGKTYSYTGDYLNYNSCPRKYMIFKKYGFIPSRSQTMFFGSLVHRTIEDLHQYLINQRGQIAV